MTAKKPIRHGTMNAYGAKKCRCDECRAANTARSTADYQKNNEARRAVARAGKRRRSAGPVPVDLCHGTDMAYGTYRCRCVECLAARKIYKAQSYQRTKQHVQERSLAWRQLPENAQAAQERTTKWRLDNPERYKAMLRSHYLTKGRLRPDRYVVAQRHRALRAGAETKLVSLSDWLRLCARFNNRCAYCGGLKPLAHEHIIPISRGGRHSIGNLLPVCKKCNSSKNSRLLVEWRRSPQEDSKMRIKYVGGSDAVEVGDQTFVRNHAVEVDDKLAGRPPEPRLAEAMAELVTARVGGDHQWQRDLQAEIATLDYGEGLLAQTDVWEAVAPSPKKKEDDK